MFGSKKDKNLDSAQQWAAGNPKEVGGTMRQVTDVLTSVEKNPDVLKSDVALADFLGVEKATAAAMRKSLQEMLLAAHKLTTQWQAVEERRNRVREATSASGVERLRAFLKDFNPKTRPELETAMRTFAEQSGLIENQTLTVNVPSEPAEAMQAGRYVFDGRTFIVSYVPGDSLVLYSRDNGEWKHLGWGTDLRFLKSKKEA